MAEMIDVQELGMMERFCLLAQRGITRTGRELLETLRISPRIKLGMTQKEEQAVLRDETKKITLKMEKYVSNWEDYCQINKNLKRLLFKGLIEDLGALYKESRLESPAELLRYIERF